MKNILIVGAGEIGRALGQVLSQTKTNIYYWSKSEKELHSLGIEPEPLPDLVVQADIVFMCVPSWAMRECLIYISPYVKKEAVVVSLAKGLEPETGRTMAELLRRILPRGQAFALLGGMMLAEEISAGLFGLAAIAPSKKASGESLEKIFAGTRIKVEIFDDMQSVALAGVLKNIYSVFMGMAESIGLGGNARGYLSEKSVTEMRKVIKALGGQEKIMLSSAGLGDFVSTSTSYFSTNVKAGKNLTKNKIDNKSEGLAALPIVASLLGPKTKDFYILDGLSRVVSGKENPEAFIRGMF